MKIYTIGFTKKSAKRYTLLKGLKEECTLTPAAEQNAFSPPQIPPPHLAIPPKKAIINIRWKLKSRRDLRVLQHPQARAGEQAPTRNSPTVHDDILIIQCRPFPHKQGDCARVK